MLDNPGRVPVPEAVLSPLVVDPFRDWRIFLSDDEIMTLCAMS